MLLLEVIVISAAVLLAAALVLWMLLLLVHAAGERKEKRAAAMSAVWLGHLLPVLDGEEDPASLPAVRGREELDVVLSLLRELLERFRGSYRERLGDVLTAIGAPDHGRRLLRARAPHERIRGAALLAWCGPGEAADDALREALGDRDPRVRLEAADALVRRSAVDSPGRLLTALGKDGAGRSLRARDLFRRWGAGCSLDWSAWLPRDWPEDSRVLLLEAAAASGTCDAGLLSGQAGHTSPRVTMAALRALETSGDPAGAAAARMACHHDAHEVRRQAAITLAACGGGADDRELLRSLLGDPSFEVRKTAFQALLGMGGAEELRSMEPADRWQRELYREAGWIAPAAG